MKAVNRQPSSFIDSLFFTRTYCALRYIQNLRRGVSLQVLRCNTFSVVTRDSLLQVLSN